MTKPTVKKVDIYAEAEVTVVDRVSFIGEALDSLIVDHYRGEPIYNEPDRSRGFFWERGGYFETLEKCQNHIDEWYAMAQSQPCATWRPEDAND